MKQETERADKHESWCPKNEEEQKDYDQLIHNFYEVLKSPLTHKTITKEATKIIVDNLINDCREIWEKK